MPSEGPHNPSPTASPYPRQRTRQTGGRRKRAYDAVIIGGGPAGLSAAIYLARFNRSVLVIDGGEGRSTTHEHNENYLGFPRGIRSRDLRERGCRQAAAFGTTLVQGRVTTVQRLRPAEEFIVRVGRKAYRARSLVLATGVTDRLNGIRDAERFFGVSLFWCITCDGWKTRGKRVLVVGNDDEAATTALQLLNFTPEVHLLTNAARIQISQTKRRQLSRVGIELIEGAIARIAGRGARIREVHTENATVPVDMVFSMQGADPNVSLARSLGVRLTGGYIKTDEEQRTNVPRVYAAGDVTRAFAHQIVTAAHEGATAAQAANYDLYEPSQR